MMGSPGREEGAPHPVSTRAASGSAGPLSPSWPRSRRPGGWGAGRGRAGTLEPRVASKEGLPVSRVRGAACGRVEERPSEPRSGSADFSEMSEGAGAARAGIGRPDQWSRRKGKAERPARLGNGGNSTPHADCPGPGEASGTQG